MEPAGSRGCSRSMSPADEAWRATVQVCPSCGRGQPATMMARPERGVHHVRPSTKAQQPTRALRRRSGSCRERRHRPKHTSCSDGPGTGRTEMKTATCSTRPCSTRQCAPSPRRSTGVMTVATEGQAFRLVECTDCLRALNVELRGSAVEGARPKRLGIGRARVPAPD